MPTLSKISKSAIIIVFCWCKGKDFFYTLQIFCKKSALFYIFSIFINIFLHIKVAKYSKTDVSMKKSKIFNEKRENSLYNNNTRAHLINYYSYINSITKLKTKENK